MATVQFPSWAYNLTAPAQIVASQAAFNALGAGWQMTPFPAPLSNVPVDPGFTDTDTRLQQIMIELRVLNLITAQGFGNILEPVDLQGLRTDVLNADSGLTT